MGKGRRVERVYEECWVWGGHTEVKSFGRGLFLPGEAIRGGFKNKEALELGFENWWDLNI